MAGIRLNHFSLLLLILFYAVKADDYTDLCNLFQDGTRLRYPGSCTEYIACDEPVAKVYSCITPTTYDQNAQNCVDFEPAASENYCRNRCEGVDGKWVADPSNCEGYYYCRNGQPLQGYCEMGYHFSESKQMCVFDTNSDCVGVSSICELVPDNTKFVNEDDCSKYYQCTKSQLKSMDCKNQYFDVDLNACADKTLTECSAHPVVSCTEKSKPIVGYLSDGATCRGYFQCKDFGGVPDLAPNWHQCPEGKFFKANNPSGPCVDPIDAVCTYNRCESRGTMLIQTSTNDCHNYIDCVDSKPVKEYSCQGDMFFDEKLHVCVYYPIYYTACDGRA